MATTGTLWVVATPIGNLQDITLRALEVLRRVELVACEDTRRTRRLLARHGLKARCVSCHAHNEPRAAAGLLAALEAGRDVALVSDGGTPAISDPGALLVSRAAERGVPVRPVPGPSAAIAALSASGIPAGVFTFRGFLPHRKTDRRRALSNLASEPSVQVFYESPVRIAASLADMAEILGARRCAIVREMTKKFEEWLRGTLPEIAASIGRGAGRGEYCVIVEGARPGAATESPVSPASREIAGAYRELLRAGLDRRAALRQVARAAGLSRSEAYRRLVEAREET